MASKLLLLFCVLSIAFSQLQAIAKYALPVALAADSYQEQDWEEQEPISQEEFEETAQPSGLAVAVTAPGAEEQNPQSMINASTSAAAVAGSPSAQDNITSPGTVAETGGVPQTPVSLPRAQTGLAPQTSAVPQTSQGSETQVPGAQSPLGVRNQNLPRQPYPYSNVQPYQQQQYPPQQYPYRPQAYGYQPYAQPYGYGGGQPYGYGGGGGAGIPGSGSIPPSFTGTGGAGGADIPSILTGLGGGGAGGGGIPSILTGLGGGGGSIPSLTGLGGGGDTLATIVALLPGLSSGGGSVGQVLAQLPISQLPQLLAQLPQLLGSFQAQSLYQGRAAAGTPSAITGLEEEGCQSCGSKEACCVDRLIGSVCYNPETHKCIGASSRPGSSQPITSPGGPAQGMLCGQQDDMCMLESGPVCFSPATHSCIENKLCPVGYRPCEEFCYDPTRYMCQEGVLSQLPASDVSSQTGAAQAIRKRKRRPHE